jgi:hypothetical protein
LKPRRIPLAGRRELVVDRAHGLTIMWIWDVPNDRCASGPFAMREGELPTLLSALADIDTGAEQAS